MGGPATSIVLGRRFSDDERSAITASLEGRGWSEDWSVVTDRPLGFTFTEPGDEDWDVVAHYEDIYELVLGWRPQAQLDLVSFVNAIDGHREIADAAIEFARLTNGLIDLGGVLDAPDGLPGNVYRPSTGWDGESHEWWVVDVEWLTARRLDPYFRMVK